MSARKTKFLVFLVKPEVAEKFIHCEIGEVFRVLFYILRVVGMMPLHLGAPPSLSYEYRFRSWLTAYSLVPIISQVGAAYVGIVHYTQLLENPMERTTTMLYILVSSCCGCVIIFISGYKARHFVDYFQLWSRLDSQLEWDDSKGHLKKCAKTLTMGYYTLSLFGLLVLIGIFMFKQFGGEKDVADSSVIAVPLVVYLTYSLAAYTLPDLVFVLLVKAIRLHFDDIREKVEQLLGEKVVLQSAACHALRKYRLAYHMTLDMVDHTNDVLAPTLLFECVSNVIQVSLMVYGFMLPMESPNKMWLTLKTSMGLLAMSKFALLCFAGSNAKQAADEITNVLKRASILKTSEENIFELELFLLESTKTKVDFTASGYFSLNLGFLSTIIGVLVTFMITIVQFDNMNGNCSGTATNFTRGCNCTSAQ